MTSGDDIDRGESPSGPTEADRPAGVWHRFLTGESQVTNLCHTPPAGADLSKLTLRRKLLFAAAISTLFLAVAVAVAEAACRLFIPVHEHYELTGDPILFYRLAADVDCVEDGNRRTQTRQHLRGPDVFAQVPATGTRRAAWVGDSACFGCGVGDEETAPFVLGTLAAHAGIRLESINLGVPGYNVRQAREVVARNCHDLRGIGAIVYYHHLNDIVNAPWAELAPFVPSELYWKYERPGNRVVRWLKRSALVRCVGHSSFVASVLKGAPEQPGTVQAVRGRESIDPFVAQCASFYDDSNRYGRQFRDDLHAMTDDARRQGATLLVVYFPVKDLLGRPESTRVAQALSRWCDKKGIVFIDVSGDFSSAPPSDLYTDAMHPGRAGQRIIAQRVWERIAP